MTAMPHLRTRRTPRWLFDALNKQFGPFELDAFAEPHNALCERFYVREQDGCSSPWADVTFANPEFDAMADVLRQASWQAERRGVRSVVLGPVGCSQSWYHLFAIQGTIYIPDRRINYDLPDGTTTHSADRDTTIMVFGGEHRNPRWKRGEFRVRRLPIDKFTPQTAA